MIYHWKFVRYELAAVRVEAAHTLQMFLDASKLIQCCDLIDD